jgi:nicotinate phosphoribosyltransferase
MTYSLATASHRFLDVTRDRPIVDSLLDTDFYKLLMLQFIWKFHPNARVKFALNNRTKRVKLGRDLDLSSLRAQLDHVRSLRFTSAEMAWLRGQTFYGQQGLFEPGFLDFLRTLSLPEYELDTTDDGQLELTFEGPWSQVSLWEIPALSIVSELRARQAMSSLSARDSDVLYGRAMGRLQDKLEILTSLDGLNLTDFGTRRRHSRAWQSWCVERARDVLGDKFTGTSNARLAMDLDLEARGTNAHELPMVLAALAGPDDAALHASQYELLKQWERVYRGGLLMLLPDTFGTTQFLAGLSPIMARSWPGARPDSKPPIEAAEELIAFWKGLGMDTTKQLILFSDGLDVDLPHDPGRGSDIPTLHARFSDRVRVGFGWGTNLTNDLARGDHPLAPISLVCKVAQANGRSCVKLSDNPSKFSGDPAEVQRYLRVFGDPRGQAVETLV